MILSCCTHQQESVNLPDVEIKRVRSVEDKGDSENQKKISYCLQLCQLGRHCLHAYNTIS